MYAIVSENQQRGVPKEALDAEKDRIYAEASNVARKRVKALFIFEKIAEKEGIRLARPLGELAERLARYRRLADRGGGDPGGRDDAATQVDAAFESLRDPAVRAASANLGLADAGGADPVDRLRAVWQQQRAGAALGDADRLRRARRALGEEIAALIRRTVDASDLVLDPALDSYHLVEAIFLWLPAVETRLGDACEGLERAPGAFVPAAARPRLAFEADELARIDHPRVLAAIATSLREDARFFGESPSLQANLPPLRDRYDAAVRAFIETARRAADSGAGDMPQLPVTCVVTPWRTTESAPGCWRIEISECVCGSTNPGAT